MNDRHVYTAALGAVAAFLAGYQAAKWANGLDVDRGALVTLGALLAILIALPRRR